MTKGTIGVTTDNIFPVIKKFLYSDHEIFLRELISNAVDATQKLKTLSSIGEYKGELGDLKVTVANGVITVKGPAADVDDVAGAIVDALTAAGYKDIKVPVKSGDIDRTVGIKGTKNSIEYAFEYVRDFNA